MATPVSASTSYCDGATLVQYYDARWIGQRLNDDGTVVPSSSVATNTTVTQLLLAASGMVESALLRGNKYQIADLQALTGASLASLKKLVADLFIFLLLQRRPFAPEKVPPQTEKALQILELLEQGWWIFGLQSQMDAGSKIRVWGPAGSVPQGYTPVSQRLLPLIGNLQS